MSDTPTLLANASAGQSAMTVDEFNAFHDLLSTETLYWLGQDPSDPEKRYCLGVWGAAGEGITGRTAYECYAKMFEGASPIALRDDLNRAAPIVEHP